MPIQMKCEPHDVPGLQVPYVQQLQQVVGNGLGFVPQMGMPVSITQGCPPIIPPVSSAPSASVPLAHKQRPAITSELKPGENIEDRIDVESIKGVFGWETLDSINVPYILRKKKKYVAVRIVERKLLSRYPNSFPDELSKKEPLVSYFVTEHEAKLLNEINSIHCSFEYGHQDFTGKDLIVDLAEFEDFYNIVKKTFPDEVLAKIRSGVPPQIPQSPVPQQPLQSASQPEHDKHELAKVCGWVQINNTVSPYIKRFNGKYVPLSVIKYAAGLLTDIQVEGILPTPAECNLLNDTCKIAGFDFNFGQSTKVIHLSEVTQRCQVNILELPFDDPLSHAQYLDIVPCTPSIKTQPVDSAVGIQPQPNMTASDLQPQVENVPPSVAPNMNPFGRYPPHYPPPPAAAPAPPPYPYMNFMNMMRQQQFPPHSMTNYSMLPQGRFPVMPPETMQGSGTVSNMNSPPRQHMSSKPAHQSRLPSQVKPNTATSPYIMGTARNPFGSNNGANSYGPNSSAKSYGPNPSRSPFGPTSPTSQFGPVPPQQAPSNQSTMYMNRMMSPQLMPNGHSQAPAPYLSHPGSRGPVNNVSRHLQNTQRFKSPNVSVLPNTSNPLNTMKIPQRLPASQFSTPHQMTISQRQGIGQSNLPADSPQFPGGNVTTCSSKIPGGNVSVRSPQFPTSPLAPVVSENNIANPSQISPRQVLPSVPVSSAAMRTPSAGAGTVPASSKITPESTEKMVSKITGVVLQGKSISCMAVNEADRIGQFCLIEAVCKLYFSRSTMDEFLYALQNVLKIPLYSCTDAEEKAFIQYYNLPVSVLKCNKMIKLTDLDNYFPQMSYMFTPPADEDESGASKASCSSANKTVPPSPASGAESNTQQTCKRRSVSPLGDAPGAKQPCRRLEEMVKKLKESQGEEGSFGKGSNEVIILDD